MEWTDPRARRAEQRFEKPMLVAALLVIPSVVLGDSGLGSPWTQVAYWLNWLIWLAFAVEMVVMLGLVRSRRRWLRDHPVEVVIVLLTAPFLGGTIASVRTLRLLRLVPLLRLATISRRLFSTEGVRAAGLLALLVFIGAGEAFSQLEPSRSLADGLYWSATTMTTVGYGDVAPTVGASRVLAVAVMFLGIGFTSFLVGALAERFVRPDIEKLAEAERDLVQGGDRAIEAELADIAQRVAALQAALASRR